MLLLGLGTNPIRAVFDILPIVHRHVPAHGVEAVPEETQPCDGGKGFGVSGLGF